VTAKICKDCLAESVESGKKIPSREANYPGPRCATHYRLFRKGQKARAAEKRVEVTFGITPEQYNLLYRLQGGKCYVCRKSTGARKRLAVDHDHRCCPGPKSCGKCVRGLACGHCNHDILPWVGDRASDWTRVANALREPIGRLLDNPKKLAEIYGVSLDNVEQPGTV
jgi:hypothetical protein